ncbi:MAG: CDP-alcohol phosphatidyltransferase family protein [Chloroflexota bacterium]|nr:CDP-alcohol phosphatidyltransferase family protein [Chloroflexota bacterium]
MAKRLTEPVAEGLCRLGVTANALTVSGFLLSLVTAWVLVGGQFFWGGVLVLFSSAFDLLDGAVARASGRPTPFGAMLDSTLDRFSEAALFFGLLVFYAARSSTPEVLLIFRALEGSRMVTYFRARAEGLGLRGEVGIFSREQRVIVLALGLILSPWLPFSLLVVLGLLAIFTHLTAVQRLLYGWQQTRAKAPEKRQQDNRKASGPGPGNRA